MKTKDIKYLVVHCADTPDDREVSAEDIHEWHTSPPRNWSGIGYHYVIKRGGQVEHGRPIYWKGAHVRGHNHDSLGICLIGRNNFTDEQLHGLRELLDELGRKFPNARPIGHNELDSHKTCPNFNVQEWWNRL